MANPFVHIELAADDVGAAKKFYGSVFDWKLQDTPMGEGMTYTMLGVGKGTGGGMMPKHMPGQPTAWLPYVAVADVTASLAKAESAGASVVVPRTEIGGGMGAFGVFRDPQGGHLGLWETSPKREAARRSTAKKKPAKKAKAAKAAKAAKPAKKKKGKR